MYRLAAIAASLAFLFAAQPAFAYNTPQPLLRLRADVRHLASGLGSPSAVEVMDLATGYSAGYNANASMPAASTIKVPVMVEVFRQLQAGAFDLNRHVTLLARDKDYGSGELCDLSPGETFPVSELLEKMIDISDNTATNMLIRLVGRSHVNATMANLGLTHTHLETDVRTSGWAIRQELRSSPQDMVRLLGRMAHGTLIDHWSSNEMISILEQDQFNTLIPAPLPDDVMVAHKTGSLFDTLNDVGIVYADQEPYVIAVMTTGLSSQDAGRSFIHRLSRTTFEDEENLARWRINSGITAFADIPAIPNAPDVHYWESGNSDTQVDTGG
jgi:beta-lactamase class A